MTSLISIQFLIVSIALIITYFFSVTILGFLQGLVAHWAGDDTPRHRGFLTLNPEKYFDTIGFLCTLFLGFGWGKLLPFNPLNIQSNRRSLKILLVYLSLPLGALTIALFSMIFNALLVGPCALSYSLHYALQNTIIRFVPMYELARSTQSNSPVALVISLLLITAFSFNLFLTTWSLLQNISYYILFIGAQKNYWYAKYNDTLTFALPLILFIFVSPVLRIMLALAIMYTTCATTGVSVW